MSEPYWEPLAATPVPASPMPVGTVVDFAGAAAPSGWLLCDGSSLLRATYPLLFAAIGTTFGAVDGTHFTLPDTRGRVTVGVGTRVECDAVGDSDNLALASRRPQHRHTVNESAHNHSINNPSHGHGISDPGHTHQQTVTANDGSDAQLRGPARTSEGGSNWSYSYTLGAGTGIGINGTTTAISAVAASTGISVGNAADYLDSPPFITFNKIIKTD